MISTIGGLFNLNHFDQGSRANDVIVIRHKDGSLHSSPFNVRFGRAKIWNSLDKAVQVEVNGVLTTAVMKIGKGGEAYWLQPNYGHFQRGNPQDGEVHTLQVPVTDTAGASTKATGTGFSPSITTAAAAKNNNNNSNTNGNNANARVTFHTSSTESGQSRLLAHGKLAQPTPAVTTTSPPQLTAPLKSEVGSSAASDTSNESMPLLQERDDGTIGVPRNAIHSAGDAEQAKLALQAVAAAEKSRKRLSRLITDDPFLLEAARQEGEADDVMREADEAEREEEEEGEGLHTDGTEALKHFTSDEKPQDETGKADAVTGEQQLLQAKAEGTPSTQENEEEVDEEAPRQSISLQGSPLLTRANGAFRQINEAADSVKGKAEEEEEEEAVSVPMERKGATADNDNTNNAKEDHAHQHAGHHARSHSGASSAGARSDDMLYGEEDDDYFLEPIDADDFDDNELGLPPGLDDTLLKNYSFSSSVTSGVSLHDVPPALIGAAAVATLPRDEHSDAQGTDVSPHKPLLRAASGDDSAVRRAETSAALSVVATARTLKDDTGGECAAPHGLPLPSLFTKEEDFRREHARMNDLGPESDVEEDATGAPGTASAVALAAGGSGQASYFTRTLLPTEEDLRKLNLQEGCNTVRYLTRKRGNEAVAVSCNIFLWDAMDRLVVSDVDGTITKSDLWGHFYQALGKGGDWTHPGICSLYSKIVGNGYKMVYLTARSVAQIEQTKNYLWTLEQEGVKLPLGPVLTAPQRFFTALTQEVSKQSHVFKIACLSGVKAAFPLHSRPFFAGFGNRYNDLISYDAVGVPTYKIFIIDPSSVLHVCQVKQTYRNLAHLVDVTFPRLHRRQLHRLHHHHHPARQQQPPQGNWTGGGSTARSHYSNSNSGGSSAVSSDSDASDTDETSGQDGNNHTAMWGGIGSPYGLTEEHTSTVSIEDERGGNRNENHQARMARTRSAMFSMSGNDLRTALLMDAELDTGNRKEKEGQGLPSFSHTKSGAEPLQQMTGAERSKRNSNESSTRQPLKPIASLKDTIDVSPFYYSYPANSLDEDVLPDPEFSSYSYWRMNPKDLISAPAAEACVKGHGKEKTGATTSAGATSKAAEASAAVRMEVDSKTNDKSSARTDAQRHSAATETNSPPRRGFSFGRASKRPSTDEKGSASVLGVERANASSPPSGQETGSTAATHVTVLSSSLSRLDAASSDSNSVTAEKPEGASPLTGSTAVEKPAQAANTGKRGFFAFGFSRGGNKEETTASAAAAAARAPASPDPYAHPDYDTYALGLAAGRELARQQQYQQQKQKAEANQLLARSEQGDDASSSAAPPGVEGAMEEMDPQLSPAPADVD